MTGELKEDPSASGDADPQAHDPDRIDTRTAFHAALHGALLEATQSRAGEIWLLDTDFADWPLGRPEIVDALAAWIDSRRQLTLLAADYRALAASAPRWHAWRRQWAHAVRCLVVHEELAAHVPSMLFVPRLVAVRLHDPERFRGRVQRAPTELAECREMLDALMQRAEEAMPVTTLGL